MLNRREVIAAGSATLFAASAAVGAPKSGTAFVRRSRHQFLHGEAPYRIAGTNMWAAAYLGAAAPVGNRERLKRELDRLAALGINNIRILGSSEFSPLKNSVRPTFRNRTIHYNEMLLRGLDYALAEMGKRRLTAVIYLTNFWEWSGGMMTYLYWTNGGRYINMNDPAHPWPEFADISSEFYGHAAAVRMFDDYVRAVVGRRNTVTGRLYREDPTIMAWQLANEPRPGGSTEAGRKHMQAYLLWINGTARLIKSIDSNHLSRLEARGRKAASTTISASSTRTARRWSTMSPVRSGRRTGAGPIRRICRAHGRRQSGMCKPISTGRSPLRRR
jgi:mannan endo-1,4-beta-mannosidase